MNLTERDREVLKDLIRGYDMHLSIEGPDWPTSGRDGVAPLDCGGGNGSDHSYRLTKLARLGLAEHRKRGYAWGKSPSRGYRGSKLYRPTELGREIARG